MLQVDKMNSLSGKSLQEIHLLYMHLKSIVHGFLRYPESRCLQVALEKILPVKRLPLGW